MDAKKLAKMGGKVLLFPVAGAIPSMRKTASLLKGEMSQRQSEIREIRALADRARANLRKPALPANDEAFEEAVSSRKADVGRTYIHFLRRKRAALVCFVFSLWLGGMPLIHGNLMGLAPLVMGCGLSFEFAWLAEFRLWQIRGRRLSRAENGSLADFWGEPGAWRGALMPEVGYGLTDAQRAYRRVLWVKRAGLAVVALGLLAAVDLFFSVSRSHVPDALFVAGVGLMVAILSEAWLMRSPVYTWSPMKVLRPEIGACYGRDDRGRV
jgi:hypothetical protein